MVWVAAGVTVATLAAGGLFVDAGAAAAATLSSSSSSSAAGSRPGGFEVSGTLVSVGQSSLKFKLSDNTMATATLTSSTAYTKSSAATAKSLVDGQEVTVVGATTDGVVAASSITIGQAVGRPGGGGQRHVPEGGGGQRPGGSGGGSGSFTPPTVGKVSGLSGGDFTVTVTAPTKKTVKVTTSSSTVVAKTSKISKSKLTVGETVNIRGTEKSNTEVAATSISEGTAGVGGPGGASPAA